MATKTAKMTMLTTTTTTTMRKTLIRKTTMPFIMKTTMPLITIFSSRSLTYVDKYDFGLPNYLKSHPDVLD